MDFKEWLKLQEAGTSTSSVAIFAQPVIGMSRRKYPEEICKSEEKPDKKKKS